MKVTFTVILSNINTCEYSMLVLSVICCRNVTCNFNCLFETVGLLKVIGTVRQSRRL